MIKAMTGSVGFVPVVEQPYDNRGLPSLLDGLPETKLKSGLIKKIPLLTGVTKHETANGFGLGNVRDTFSSATEFLKSVSGSLNLEKLLSVTKDLPKINIPGTENILQLADLLKVPENLDPLKMIAKVDYRMCIHLSSSIFNKYNFRLRKPQRTCSLIFLLF